MVKNYIFNSKPFEFGLFIRNTKNEDQSLEGMNPACEEEIDAFEKSLGSKLPEPYREFLLNCNGGIIDPNRAGRIVACDLVSAANGGDVKGSHDVAIDRFFSLDIKTIEELSKTDSYYKTCFLPTACAELQSLLSDDDNEDDFGLSSEALVPIADSTPWGVVLSCKGKFKDKVLSINFNSYAANPLDNVGILANSFDEFIQSLYYVD